jgi:pantoate--beta-alanine ligase
MQPIFSLREFQAFCREAQRPLGLVPTMGALHEGHLSMVRQAQQECASVTVSIFVNPTQFGPQEDIEHYPRPLQRDLEMLENEGVDAVFMPTPEGMYPLGSATTVMVNGPTLPLEGKVRPGHFQGVATVVAKLLLLALPQRAYFGQKDAQQAAVVRRLVADLSIPTEVCVLPTVRELDGLALSSRNVYLTAEKRRAAPVVYRALQAAKARYEQGERRSDALEAECRGVLESEPLVGSIDYVALVDPDSFQPLGISERGTMLLVVAVRLGGVRLLDNLMLGVSHIPK